MKKILLILTFLFTNIYAINGLYPLDMNKINVNRGGTLSDSLVPLIDTNIIVHEIDNNNTITTTPNLPTTPNMSNYYTKPEIDGFNNTFSNNITTNKNNITTNKNNITTNTNNITTNTSDITTNKNSITDNRSDINTNTNNITTNRDNIYNLSNDLHSNYYDKSQIDKKFQEQDKGLALAAALANLKDNFRNGNKSLSVGISYYKKQSALAVRYAYKDKNNLIYNISIATNSDNNLYSVSVSVSW